jgi:copper(I)-binding protein
VLEPGGLHIMLIGLKQKLAPGDSIPLTLVFEHAGEVTVEIPVRAMAGMGMGGHGTMGEGVPKTN